MIADGSIGVFGILDRQGLPGASYCGRIFDCLGHARVDALREERHRFDFLGSMVAWFIAPATNIVRPPPDAPIGRDFRRGMIAGQLRGTFDASVLADEALDYAVLHRALWGDRPPLH